MSDKQKNLPEYLQKILSMIPDGGRRVRVGEIMKATDMTNTAVRNGVRELIFKYDYPIGTDNTRRTPGYFIISTEEDQADTVRNLRSRARHIDERADKISKMILPKKDDEAEEDGTKKDDEDQSA